ncbi:hypothetical protein V5279_05595 [Bradyrhizobium sp. 26S5]
MLYDRAEIIEPVERAMAKVKNPGEEAATGEISREKLNVTASRRRQE